MKFSRLIILFSLLFVVSCSWRVNKSSESVVSEQQEREFFVYVEGEHRIYFKHGGYIIEDEGVERVNALIDKLSIVKNVTVMIYGYADKSEKESKKLSEMRVNSVKKALKDSGIIATNNISMKTFAFGRYDSSASFGMPNNNPTSRRVDVFIVANNR